MSNVDVIKSKRSGVVSAHAQFVVSTTDVV